MAVKLRLARCGKKKAPFYRIVAIDGRSKRDGRFLEDLGTYNALTGEIIQFHEEKLNAWVAQGAVLTDVVKRIQKVHKKQQSTAVAA